MPELPEVETIKNELLPYLINRKFTGVTICDSRLISQPLVEEFCRKLPGQIITDIQRRGKYLIFYLSHGEKLLMHLRMTGVLLINSDPPDRYIRASFRFDDGNELFFVDFRRLGVVWLVEDEEAIIGKLGTEPLSDGFTAELLARLLHNRQAPIKAVLLDQTIIAGIGNMYADEALFEAKIHPMRKAGSLSSVEVGALYMAINDVLKLAIDRKGASVSDYARPGGERGTAQTGFCVAHKLGQACQVCGTAIQRIKVRNRGTYFCPFCQKDKQV